eukprot:CAMPEP_0196751224 /NCGR_PEP_ID=MMETSP1091-20130531/83063_1 /TAXON_ID=302021 /ORGANISM="Rhodomonas sp., Strain CCMP768" /LENGTH=54 /DNA_ID=CAMNT_0042098981 /DNA_START=22 /DNA_END=186 /DNA_ORIENTATION=-
MSCRLLKMAVERPKRTPCEGGSRWSTVEGRASRGRVKEKHGDRCGEEEDNAREL